MKLSTLGYAILVAMDTRCAHYYEIIFKDTSYETLGKDDFPDDTVTDPNTVELSNLNLSEGDKMVMKYDFITGWNFLIEVV